MSTYEMEKKIVIVGGGVGGVKCALELAKKKLPNTKIVLISDKSHFEYHGALYRIVTGHSPLEVCIPLREIFTDNCVEVVDDMILGVDLHTRRLSGKSGSHYTYDFLVLALGSETAYFNIPGLMDNSHSFKSIREAIKLKDHIHANFSQCVGNSTDKTCAVHFVVVGAGASGCELAAELAIYTRLLAKSHKIDESLITIDLIDNASRILPSLPESFSTNIEKRIRSLGVNVYLNRTVVKEDVDEIFFSDMNVKAKTLIWTAGVMANALYRSINGLETNKAGKVLVENLSPEGLPEVFILGDGAATKFSGMAQTALYDGVFAANSIATVINRSYKKFVYKPKQPIYIIPVGSKYAGVLHGSLHIYGRLGWWIRRLFDLEIYLNLLSFKKAWTAFRSDLSLCETCEICGRSGNI